VRGGFHGARDRAHRVEECGDALGERGAQILVQERQQVGEQPGRGVWLSVALQDLGGAPRVGDSLVPSPEAARWTACAQSAVHAKGGAHAGDARALASAISPGRVLHSPSNAPSWRFSRSSYTRPASVVPARWTRAAVCRVRCGPASGRSMSIASQSKWTTL
jgi:hypothetical protein